MLRISKLTDYAVVVATLLEGASAQASSQIARRSQLPEPTVKKLLKLLARGGVAQSLRGAKGGYILSRPKEDISIRSIIEAIEGPIAVTECSDDRTEPTCEFEEGCGVRTNWQRINDAVHEALDGISLADMATSELSLVSLSMSRRDAAALRGELKV